MKYRLGDVVQFIDYRGKTPPKTTDGIPLITAKIVKDNVIQTPTEYIAADFYDEWMRRGIPRKGAVVFTTEAPLGEVAQIKTTDKLAFAQRIIIMQGEKDKLDDDFLFYSLQYLPMKERIQARSTGTTVVGIKAAELRQVEIDLPDLTTQRGIAITLRSLDDKIANNSKINHHLEQMAQAVFTEFCSEGENTVLSNILTVCYGKDHKRLGAGEIPCYGSGGIMRYVDEALYSGESVLIPRKGTLNNVLYINEPFWTMDTMFYTHMTHPNVAKFVYFTVRALDLAGMNVGSAVPSMTTAVLNALEITLPSDDALANFEETISPMFLQIQANNAENARLAELRDALLPRLMSGELSVVTTPPFGHPSKEGNCDAFRYQIASCRSFGHPSKEGNRNTEKGNGNIENSLPLDDAQSATNSPPVEGWREAPGWS